jgi:4-amino-4-deoxy-L-arabinose transferase-like glycosyltransferase
MQRMFSHLQSLLSRWKTTEMTMVVIIAVAAFLRLWNFPNTLEFLGDQGRDAMVVARLIQHHDAILLGPVTSTGNMYLGPLYYYFMAPFLWLSHLNPIGPAYAVAVLSILTVFLMYRLGKELVGERAAVIAAAGMTFSATVVTLARFSWNPNPAPLFGLLLIWGIYRALTKNPWYWTLCAICISVMMQLHYITLLTIPASGLVWLYQVFALRKNQKKLFQLIQATLVSVLIFLLFLSPLILFDFRHNFINATAFNKFLSADDSPLLHATGVEKITRILKETHGRSMQLFFESTIGKNRNLNTLLVTSSLVFFVYLAFQKQKKKKTAVTMDDYQLAHRLLLLFLSLSILGLSFYQGNVYFHYIAFLFPLVFLMFGVIIDQLWKYKVGVVLSLVGIAGFMAWNIQHMPINDLGWKISDVKRTSQTILEKVKPGEKYNIVLLSETKDSYGQNYRYFLNVTDKPTVSTDHPETADTLYIINEQHLPGDVTQQSIYEIAIFPNKLIREVYTVPGGPEIIVLKK